MIEVVTADPVHLHLIQPQEAQSVERGTIATAELATHALPRGPAWAILANGRVIFVGGFIEHGAHWATAWAILAQGIGPLLRPVTRTVAAYVAAAPYARVDMYIDPEFEQSVRWAKHIGMAQECVMAKAKANGGPMFIFAKVEE